MAQQKVTEASKQGLGSYADGPAALNARAVKALTAAVKVMDESPGCFSAEQVQSMKESLADSQKSALSSEAPTKSP
ncbi:hypothetical protein [Streptomyces sp. NPDC001205]